MTASAWFLLLVAVLIVTGALSVWKPTRRRYPVPVLLLLAAVLALMTHVSHQASTAAVQRERDDARARFEAIEDRVDGACSKATTQILLAEAEVEANKDPFGAAGYLLYYGSPLFDLCGAEVDWMHAVGETDKQKQLARIRAVREVLERR